MVVTKVSLNDHLLQFRNSTFNLVRTETQRTHELEYFLYLITAAQPCTNETLRLVDGPVESAGRVEICINGVWGTVCHNGWDNNDTRVVCEQLGYSDNLDGGELLVHSDW